MAGSLEVVEELVAGSLEVLEELVAGSLDVLEDSLEVVAAGSEDVELDDVAGALSSEKATAPFKGLKVRVTATSTDRAECRRRRDCTEFNLVSFRYR